MSSSLHLRGKRGMDLLHDPLINKGTAFTEAERDALGLRGLLPPRVYTTDQQLVRVYASYQRKPDPLEKYIYLVSLQERNEMLFYRLVLAHLEEMVARMDPEMDRHTARWRKPLDKDAWLREVAIMRHYAQERAGEVRRQLEQFKTQ